MGQFLYTPRPKTGSISVSKVITESGTTVKTPKYGATYNWYAATDVKGIAPVGWHVPSKDEFDILTSYLGGFSIAGGKLKEIGLTYWTAPNTGATNEVGFNGRGSGSRSSTGIFPGLKGGCVLQANNLSLDGHIYILTLSYSSASGGSSTYAVPLTTGMGIRCIKDDSTDTGTVTDYDGNIYPTIKIGDQVWMAANLIVEHYNDGTPIPNITDNTAWSSLTTGAMCYYNNDIDNAFTTTTTPGNPLPDDTTVFRCTLTGQSEYPTIVGPSDLSQEAPSVFKNLPFDTYVITEEVQDGYTQTSVHDPIVLTRSQRNKSVTVVNEIESLEQALELTFDDIANVPVADASSLSDWNTLFNLPFYGTPFNSVSVVGNVVTLTNIGNIIIGVNVPGYWNAWGGLVKIIDEGIATEIIGFPFEGQDILIEASFPNVTYIAEGLFYWCYELATLYIPSCTNLGGTVGYDTGFQDLSVPITITIPSSLMTCNSGNPDGDIQYLIDTKVVTIITV